jgi:hypothetical protein
MNSKRIVKTMVLLLGFFAISSLMFAGKGLGPNSQPARPAACTNFVDANGDGICDNCRQGLCDSFVDANGDGICDNCRHLGYQHDGANSGNGPGCGNFVDADGDGVCDNCDQSDCQGGGACDGTGPKGPGPRN